VSNQSEQFSGLHYEANARRGTRTCRRIDAIFHGLREHFPRLDVENLEPGLERSGPITCGGCVSLRADEEPQSSFTFGFRSQVLNSYVSSGFGAWALARRTA
jgi:hypothetical protein